MLLADLPNLAERTTHYVYGGASHLPLTADGSGVNGWQVCEERNGSGDTVATYVHGRYIDEVLAMQRGGVDYYYHTDDLYNVMAVTDENGSAIERYEYDDYGTPLYFIAPDGTAHTSSAIANPYLFTCPYRKPHPWCLVGWFVGDRGGGGSCGGPRRCDPSMGAARRVAATMAHERWRPA